MAKQEKIVKAIKKVKKKGNAKKSPNKRSDKKEYRGQGR